MIEVAMTVLATTCAVLAAASWLAEARRPRVFPRSAAAAVAAAAALCAVAYPLVLPTGPRAALTWAAGSVLLVVAAIFGAVGTVGIAATMLPRGGLGGSFADGLLVGAGAVTTVWAVLAQPGTTLPARTAAVLVAALLAGLLAAVLRLSVTARGHPLESRHTRRANVAAAGFALLVLAGLVAAVPAQVPLAPTMLLAAGGLLLVALVPYVGDGPQTARTSPTFAALVLPHALLAVAAAAVGVQVALGRAGVVTGLLVAVVGCSVVGVQVFGVRAATRLLSDLERSRQRLEALVENAQDVILGLDAGGRVVAANLAVERLLACRPEQLEGRDVAEIAVLDDRPAVRDAVRDVVHRRRPTAKVELRLAAPADGTAEMRLRVVDGGAVAVVSDVTDAVLLRERLQLLARHDRMTGLVNRGVVLDTVATWLASGAAVTVLYCDLDGYKAVNDRFGHLAGDGVLVEVAGRLETAVRGMPAEEGLLGRIGGDEFVVALRGVHGREAVGAGERLVAAMRPTFVVGDRTVRLGISIGISGTDDVQPLPALGAGAAAGLADTPAAELLHRGDLAMFEAKTAGRAKVARWDPDVSQRALRRVDIAIGLRQALDTGRLALAYQPLVRLSDGVVVGVEALVRVEGGGEPGALAGVSGFVSPAELVEVAEDTGEITELGQWVLRQATQRAALWRAHGHDLFVTVNMSVRQLSEAGFVTTVRRALVDSTLEPGRLVVEITEGQLVGEEDPVRDVIEDLRGDGVQFVIDDFGTGYSSLSYLRSMPVRAIKLDRTLLDGVGTDPRATTLIRGVIGVARGLGLVVVVEGLEDLEAARLVRDLGAWAGQGFALHPPLREDDLLTVLSAAALDLSGGRSRDGDPTASAAPSAGPAAGQDPTAAGMPSMVDGPQTQGISLGGRRFGSAGPVGEAPRVTGGASGVAGVVLPPRAVSDGETGQAAD